MDAQEKEIFIWSASSSLDKIDIFVDTHNLLVNHYRALYVKIQQWNLFVHFSDSNVLADTGAYSDNKICFNLYCAKHATNARKAQTAQAEEYSSGSGILSSCVDIAEDHNMIAWGKWKWDSHWARQPKRWKFVQNWINSSSWLLSAEKLSFKIKFHGYKILKTHLHLDEASFDESDSREICAYKSRQNITQFNNNKKALCFNSYRNTFRKQEKKKILMYDSSWLQVLPLPFLRLHMCREGGPRDEGLGIIDKALVL